MSNIFIENNQTLSDELLVEKIKNGEYKFLPFIIDHYMSAIVYYAENFLPEAYVDDAVQEATIALYNAVKQYDSQKSSFKTFANLCIKRSIFAFARKNGAQKNIPDDMRFSLNDTEISDSNTPETIVIAKESYNNLTKSIRLELSAMEYDILQLFLSGMSYSAIAKSLEISEKSVDNALSRIRKKIKK